MALLSQPSIWLHFLASILCNDSARVHPHHSNQTNHWLVTGSVASWAVACWLVVVFWWIHAYWRVTRERYRCDCQNIEARSLLGWVARTFSDRYLLSHVTREQNQLLLQVHCSIVKDRKETLPAGTRNYSGSQVCACLGSHLWTWSEHGVYRW